MLNFRLRHNLPKESNSFITDYLTALGIENIQDYIEPNSSLLLNPYDLNNIEKGARLLIKHLEQDSNICLPVDSDADGIGSAAILWLYCKKIFPNCKLSYLLHSGKQHGLEDHITYLQEDIFNLILIADASTNDLHECAALQETGMDVLILDHHVQTIANPYATIINNQISPNYSNKSLCGGGVVYKFCKVLDDILGVDYADSFLDLVALTEISDMMDLRIIENRYLVSEGLSYITNPGFRAFIEKQAYSLKDTTKITPMKIAFYITPLINALIRVGNQKEKEILFRAFIEGDIEVQSTKRGASPGDKETIAAQAARLASNARNKQNKLKEEAIHQLEHIIQNNDLLSQKILILPFDDIDVPNTLTGLIAMFFCNRYQRPVLALRRDKDGYLKGSGRGDDRFYISDLQQYLLDSNLFEYSEGHANAQGNSIHEDNLSAFYQYLDETLPQDAFNEIYYPVDYIFDTTENFGEPILDLFYYDSLWGQGVAEPKFAVQGVIHHSQIQFIGNNTTKISLPGGEIIKFKDEEFQKALGEYKQPYIKVYGSMSVNTWMDKQIPQLIINDYSISEGLYAF